MVIDIVSTIFPELESAIPKLLDMISNRIERERASIIKILERVEWNASFNRDLNSCIAIGADSSFTIVDSRVGTIYVVQGIAIRQTFTRSLIKIEEYIRFYDAGLISIKSSSPNRIIRRSIYKRALSTYAYLLELQSAYSLAKSGSADVVLLDGSLISFLMQRDFKGISMNINSISQAKDTELREVLEKKNILINELSNLSNTIFIAKSSSACFYTNGMYPDMYVFELAKLFRIEPYYRAGYSTPMVIEIDGTLKKFLGIDKECGIQFFTVTYSRFADGAPVFQLTLPHKIYIDKVGSLFSYVKMLSPSGYPMPLEYPHRISRLARSTLIDILIKIGIPIISGRELVEL